jgi:hypothetical protein
MKQTFIKTAAAAILITSAGYTDSKTVQGNVTAATEQISIHSLEERKNILDRNIHAFALYGFEVNRTSSDTYLLKVKDEKKAAASLLRMFHIGTIENEDLEEMESYIKEASFSITVEWQRYASNQNGSLIVSYLGNGREAPSLARMLKAGKVAAYLGFDHNDRLTQIKVKDIDETLLIENEKAHILLKGMHAKLASAHNYDLFGGTFRYTLESEEDNTTVTFGYTKPLCHIAKTNAYLGKQQCIFPTLHMLAATSHQPNQERLSLTVNDTTFNYHIDAQNKKAKATMHFNIASVELDERGTRENNRLHIGPIQIEGTADNIDETLLASYTNAVNHPSKEDNRTMIEALKAVGKLYGAGITFDYRLTVDAANGIFGRNRFHAEQYRAHGTGSLGTTVEYQDRSSIRQISVTDAKTGHTVFALQALQFGYGIHNLYNILPVLTEVAASLAQQQTEAEEQKAEKKLLQAAADLVHHGFTLSLSPLGWEMLEGKLEDKTAKMGKVDFKLSASLAKNSAPVDLDNPMVMMMLIPYIHADGKLVLGKDDLEMLAGNMPPEIIGMLMMYARYEGNNAVFVLKYENGRLTINGQPVM